MKMTWFPRFAWTCLAAMLLPLTRSASAQTLSPSSSAPATSGTVRQISLEEFDKLRSQTNYTVLDVRSPGEFAAGHVPGATNISVSASDFAKRIATLDKEKPCLVHCAAGVRSARAVGTMKRMGFKQIYDFSGGWQEWKKAGKPVEK